MEGLITIMTIVKALEKVWVIVIISIPLLSIEQVKIITNHKIKMILNLFFLNVKQRFLKIGK